jgi:hypothetical protein
MFDVLGIVLWHAIFCIKPEVAWVAHISHHLGVLPTGGELVPPFTLPHTLEHEVINLKCSFAYEPIDGSTSGPVGI